MAFLFDENVHENDSVLTNASFRRVFQKKIVLFPSAKWRALIPVLCAAGEFKSLCGFVDAVLQAVGLAPSLWSQLEEHAGEQDGQDWVPVRQKEGYLQYGNRAGLLADSLSVAFGVRAGIENWDGGKGKGVTSPPVSLAQYHG